jgi:hypothetical protein
MMILTGLRDEGPDVLETRQEEIVNQSDKSGWSPV